MRKGLSLLLILALLLTMSGQVAPAEGDECEMGGYHDWRYIRLYNCETGESGFQCAKCFKSKIGYIAPKSHNYVLQYVPIPGPEVNRHTTPHTPGGASRRLGSGQTAFDAAAKATAGSISHLRAGGKPFSVCTDPYRKQQYCTVCGTTIVMGDYPPMGHNYGESWKPMADRPGYEIGTCIRCGGTWTREIEHEHEWGEWYTVTEATSEEMGVEERECGICGVTETREVVPAPAPTPSPWEDFTLTLEIANAPRNGEYYVYGDSMDGIQFNFELSNNSPYDAQYIMTDVLGTDFINRGETLTIESGKSAYWKCTYFPTAVDVFRGKVANHYIADITTEKGNNLTVISNETEAMVGANSWSPTGEDSVPSYILYLPPEELYTGDMPEEMAKWQYGLTLEITNTPPNIDENGEGYYALGDEIEFTYTMTRGVANKLGDYFVRSCVIYDTLSDKPIDSTLSYRDDTWYSLPHVMKSTYKVMEDDVKAGFVENQAYSQQMLVLVDDKWNYGSVHSNTVSAKTGGEAPEVRLGLSITNEPKNGRYYTEGEVVEFTYTLTGDDGRYQDKIDVYHDLLEKDSAVFSEVHVGSPDLVKYYTVTASDVKKGEVVSHAYAYYDSGAHVTRLISSPYVTFETAPGEPELKLELNRVGSPAIADGYQEGEEIEYEFVLTAGDDRVYDPVVITDTLTGASLTAGVGGNSDSYTGTAYYVVTENDISAGAVVNTAKAVYTDETGKTFEVSSDDCVADCLSTPRIPDPFEVGDSEVPETGLTLTMKDISDYGNGSFHVPGETVIFYIEAYNTTDEPVYDVTITDLLCPTGSFTFAEIEPHAGRHFRYPYVVISSDAEAGGIWNSAQADYSDANGGSYSVPSNVLYVPCYEELPEEVSASVTKTEVSAYPNGLFYREDETVEYDLSINNTTGKTIYNVEFIDEGIHYSIGTLEAYEYAQVSHFHNVTSIDVSLGCFTNQAYAVWGEEIGKQDKGTVTNTVTVPCGEDEPERRGSVTVSKTVLNPQEEYHPGDTVMYSIIVYNGLDVPVLDVDVYDDFTNLSVFSSESVGHADRIEAGEGRPFFYNHSVTDEDVLGGQMGNEAYAIFWPEDSEISNCAVSNFVIVNAAPGEPEAYEDIVVTKYELSTPKNGKFYKVGETVTFAVAVANPTGETFTGVDCYDILLEDSGYYCGSVITLGSEPTVFRIDYVVTDIDAILGNVSNIAWVDAIDSNGDLRTVMSNEVIVPVEEGGRQSGGNGGFCSVYVSAEGEGIMSVRTDYCAAHAKAAETAAQLMEEGNTAAAKALWQSTLNAAYTALSTGTDEETADLITREQAAFEMKLTSLAAICEAEGMDSAGIDRMLIDALRERVCELCADKAVMNKAYVRETETAAISAPVNVKCVVETAYDPMGSTKTLSLCMTHRAGDKAIKRLSAALEESTEEQQKTLRNKMLATRESELDAALMKLMTSADAKTKPLIIRYKAVLKSELDLRSRVLTAIRGEAPAVDLLLQIYKSETAFLCSMQ